MGFKPGIGRDQVQRCIETDGELNELMNFVEVEVGDAFYIDAGIPHAIGRGVTLLEPQTITPGCRGVTYRFWDWNRRYDANGALDPAGEPRPLHVQRSLTWRPTGGGRGFPRRGGSFEPIRLSRRMGIRSARCHRMSSLRDGGMVWLRTTEFPALGTMLTLTCARASAARESVAQSIFAEAKVQWFPRLKASLRSICTEATSSCVARSPSRRWNAG